jgi:hypothetical protein
MYNYPMREWYLPREILPSLVLAADIRLSSANYFDDQIWELDLRSGAPAAVSFQTTYGLRARSMRMFPRFGEGDSAVEDPNQFHEKPAFRLFYPNYTLITYAPFDGIDVVSEYWVPGSNLSGGRIRVINSGVTPRKIRFDWIALLVQGETGRLMAPDKIQGAEVLHGEVGNLAPVVFLSGGVESRLSPYPSLHLEMELLPGIDRQVIWGHGGGTTTAESFDLARSFINRNWDAEQVRIQMTNASQLEIESGNPAWDVAFTLGQNTAYHLMHGPTDQLPHPSFVHTRLPNQGYSLRGDGSDYDHFWNGQNMLETWHLCSQLLPASPETARDLLENFLATQSENGHVDWQPSLNGRRSGMLATPMLCSLAWRIYQYSEDRVFLVKTFHQLKRFIDHWFSIHHDRDQDGIPEWDHPMQSGFEDNPLFAHWQPWAQGADISLFESPSLTGLLYREIRSLQKIAREIQYQDAVDTMEARLEALQQSIETSWDAENATYRYLDRATHRSPHGELLKERTGPGKIALKKFEFSEGKRLSIRIRREGEGEREPAVKISGKNEAGEDFRETVPPDKIHWALRFGTAISGGVYTMVRYVEIANIQPEDQVSVYTIDYRHQDQTLMAPLWAGASSEERARSIIRKTLLNPSRFWQAYGLPACITRASAEADQLYDSVWVPWNTMIGEGMVHYGQKEAAAELLSRLMDAISLNVQHSGGFRKHYHAKTGQGIGERNAVLGLPPMDLFLITLGVQVFSNWKVGLRGRNPYQKPVIIQFRGLKINRGLDATEVTFPNGKTLTITDSEPCIIQGQSA